MADELQKINNPDSIPGAVSTGWQQEIANTITQRNGLDCTAPVAATATTISLPAGGPVDVNGVLYSLTTPATLTIPLTDTDYYIYLTAGSADHLTPTLTTNPGTFDASKNARYTTGGERILNWVVRRDASAAYVFKMDDPQDVDGLTGQDLRKTADVTHRDGTFTGDVSVEGDIGVNGAISGATATLSAAVCFDDDEVLNTFTYGQVYSALSTLLPNIGDRVILSGYIQVSSVVKQLCWAYRTSSTQIRLANGGTYYGHISLNSGDGSYIQSLRMITGFKF